MKPAFPRYCGFTIVELLVTIGVIAIMAGIAIPLVRGVPEAAKKDKLEQDVSMVNNAIDSYLAAGGNQTNLTPDNVIAALKTRIYEGMTAEMLGPQGPFLDPRLVTNATDFGWSALFTDDPRPRFLVAQSTNGVVFGKGPAAAIGGVAARPDAARPSWLWTYAQATPPPQMEGFTPLAIDTGFVPAASLPISDLGPPLILPGSQTNQLWAYPLEVRMTNTNTPAGASRIYYKVGGGNFSLYDDVPFRVGPGTELVALCVSLDPSRYRNSSAVTNFYGVSKLALAVKITAPATVTYAQAGGLMQGIDQLQPATAIITLEDTNNMFGDPPTPDNLMTREVNRPDDKFIPAEYLRDANFTIRYTMDGSNPSEVGVTGPSFDGFFTPVTIPLGLAVWGTNSSIDIQAVAIASSNSILFSSSPTNMPPVTTSIEQTSLPLTVIPANPIGLPFQVQLTHSDPVPVGLRQFYRTDGGSPLTSETGGLVQAGSIAYSAPVPSSSLPSAPYTLTAQATGPAGYEQWFSSALSSRNYTTITVLNPDFVGANVSGGDVNGSFRGSIFVSAPANLGIFNAGGQVLSGNLYVPGLPAIETPGSGNSTKTVVARGAYFDQSQVIPRTLIAGKELSADGVLANPQIDTRQIVDLNGSGFPTNYTVKLTKSSFIEGKIYRNVDVPPPPPVPQVPLGLIAVTNIFTGRPAQTLLPGIYSNNITMSGADSVIRLGEEGSMTVSRYIFSGSSFRSGRVEILGPVEIYFTTGFANDGVVFGGTNTVNQLRINVMAGNVDIKNGGEVYARLWASNNVSVGNRGFFFGSLYARELTVAPNGTVNVEP